MINLASPERKHQPHHDLESFFYVIITIMMLYEKPGMKRSPSFWKEKDKDLEKWWNVTDWRGSALWKLRAMCTELEWTMYISSSITNYFKCWEGCISELRRAIFDTLDVKYVSGSLESQNPSPITYDRMISILKKMIEIGEAADEKERGRPFTQEECGDWADHFALESADGSQVDPSPATMEWVFPKVEAFRLMDAINRSAVEVPNSDAPADRYPADPYHGGMPSKADIPKYQDPSTHTSDLPTSSTSTAVWSSVPPTSGPSTSISQRDVSSGKRTAPAPATDFAPPQKKPRKTQPPSSSTSRKVQSASTSTPSLNKTSSRKSGGKEGRKSKAGKSKTGRSSNASGKRAPAPGRSRRTKEHDNQDYVSSETKDTEEYRSATYAAERLKRLLIDTDDT